MEATVAERGQITLPKAVRDALGLTKGTKLKVELDGARIVLRKDVSDAMSRMRGRLKLPPGVSTDDIMRALRGRAPGDPIPAWDQAPAAVAAPRTSPKPPPDTPPAPQRRRK
jgi:AbrB family looped-hinge helix DNA binding protein